MPTSIAYPDPATLGNAASSYTNTALGGYPGYAGIKSNLAGTLAPDVKRAIYQAAAERGIGIGSYGSPNVDANLLRSIGLTSADLQAKGQDQLTAAIGAMPKFDLGSQYVDPTQQASLNTSEAIAEANRKAQAEIAAGNEAGANYRAQMEANANAASRQAALDAQARLQREKYSNDQNVLALLDQIQGRYSGGNQNSGPSNNTGFTQYGWLMPSGGGSTSPNYSTSGNGWDTGEWPTDSSSTGWSNYTTSPQGWDTGEWPTADYTQPATDFNTVDPYSYNPQPTDFSNPTFDPYYSDYFGG